MTRQDIIDRIAVKATLTKGDAADALDSVLEAILEAIPEALARGEDVRLTGFGTFSVAERAASEGRKPAHRGEDPDRGDAAGEVQARQDAAGAVEPQAEDGRDGLDAPRRTAVAVEGGGMNPRGFALALAALAVALTACGPEPYELESGWYRWADQANSPARYAPPAMARFDMSNRCLCSPGFKVTDTSATTFKVIKAPLGYSDTLNKEFVKGKVACLNCAD
jgi:DNA-binding protein HU-beta